METKKRDTKPVQVDINVKKKVEAFLFKKKQKGDYMPIGKFFEIAAEEKLKSENK